MSIENTLFIDSSVLFAFASIRDVHHTKATKIMELVASNKYDSVLINDYVFDEVLSVILRKSGKKDAVEIGSHILDSEIFVAKIDSDIFQKSWDLFRQLDGFSFTDCSILAFMKTLGIKKIATFDKEFRKVDWLEVVDS